MRKVIREEFGKASRKLKRSATFTWLAEIYRVIFLPIMLTYWYLTMRAVGERYPLEIAWVIYWRNIDLTPKGKKDGNTNRYNR